MANPKALLLAFAIGCGGASADILDASDDATLESSTDAIASSDVSDGGSELDATADVVANDASDASSEAAPKCTPLVDGAVTKYPPVGCTCADQLQGCTFAKPGADCRWFVELNDSTCSGGTRCPFYPVPDSGACAACAETYNCACVGPLFTAVNPKCKCIDSDAGPYCEVQ